MYIKRDLYLMYYIALHCRERVYVIFKNKDERSI